MLIRLQKYLADSGIASRRKAESLILAGQIKVNGQIVTQLGTKIEPGQDKVSFRDKLVKPEKFIYILLNKPKGYTCTTRKFKNEPNVLDLVRLPAKLFPVGRLDKDSRGLIILTNDGQFAYEITHPKFQIVKEYLVETDKPALTNDLAKMKTGLKDQGELLKIQAFTLKAPKLILLTLTQGHKREIRRLFKRFNYHVVNLTRLQIHKWELGNLKPGEWQYFQP